MNLLLRFADAIDWLLTWIGRLAGTLFLVNTLVISLDVFTRKAGVQLGWLGSTRLQELEWHLHAALFSFWLGAAYLRNAHVRVDVAVGSLSDRARARLELVGCLFLALPFLLVVLYYGHDFVLRSFMQNEGSPSPTGLPARYVIKATFIFGFFLLLLAVLATAARCFAFLRGTDVNLPHTGRMTT